ncbi:hypothetical protein [Arthrobacter sp. M4]|uniref:hypothetical protein n=1 Tax=Arthrobacter sp. M4 TaxID=218160 RepID=UPI001CDB8C4A|nr:hypothetical protein [Arthrobacter sp. M4]MCA4133386.1 hypothetical protein [Arthrobacter sp. M4]
MSARMQSSASNSPHRLYQKIDWVFALFLVLEFVAFPLFPGLPLLVVAASMTTTLRRSKWRQLILWAMAGIMTLIVLAPFVIGWFQLSFVENGPATPAK